MNVKLTHEVVLEIIKKPAVQRIASDLKRIHFSIKDFSPKACCGDTLRNKKVKDGVNLATNIILNMDADKKKQLKSILGMKADEHFTR